MNVKVDFYQCLLGWKDMKEVSDLLKILAEDPNDASGPFVELEIGGLSFGENMRYISSVKNGATLGYGNTAAEAVLDTLAQLR